MFVGLDVSYSFKNYFFMYGSVPNTVFAKHFAVNSQETDRTKVDERLSQRALRELYLKGFEMMVRKSNPWTIMSAYNKINGVYAQGNKELLTDILRNDWAQRDSAWVPTCSSTRPRARQPLSAWTLRARPTCPAMKSSNPSAAASR